VIYKKIGFYEPEQSPYGITYLDKYKEELNVANYTETIAAILEEHESMRKAIKLYDELFNKYEDQNKRLEKLHKADLEEWERLKHVIESRDLHERNDRNKS
jgi:hypothetical protein